MRPFLVENPPRVFRPYYPTSEAQFEEQVLRVAGQLMPNYSIAEWKPLVRDWEGHGAKPDLVMVSQDLDSWYVVEVELASHSIPGHIGPQLETLRKGVYDRSLVPSLEKAFPFENVDSLIRMVGRDPGLLCIVDQYTEQLSRVCRNAGFELIVMEPYYGKLGGWAISVEQLPSEFARLTAPTRYMLSRGHPLGESVVMELPRHFPASFYKIRVPALTGEQLDSFVQVQRFERRLGVVLPVELIPEHSTARVEIVDPVEGIAELIVET